MSSFINLRTGFKPSSIWLKLDTSFSMWCAFSRLKKVFSLSISVVSKDAANVWGSIAGFSDQLCMLVGSMQREPFVVPGLS